jgi:hypothetical protein
MNNAKKQFAATVQSVANQIAMFDHLMADLNAVYSTRQYGPGWAEAYTDEELATLEDTGGRAMTVADPAVFIAMCQQFELFIHNGTPVQYDYTTILAKPRTDI